MDYFLLYLLFAVATAFTAVYELLYPVIVKELAEQGKVENLYLIYPVFFIIFMLTAPVGFLSCIIPAWGIIFRETLQKALFSEE